MVNGFVKKSRAYAYVPGYLAYNYISMAGGNTRDGSINKIKIIHTDGTSTTNSDKILKRGDVIIVERSIINTLLWQCGAFCKLLHPPNNLHDLFKFVRLMKLRRRKDSDLIKKNPEIISDTKKRAVIAKANGLSEKLPK